MIFSQCGRSRLRKESVHRVVSEYYGRGAIQPLQLLSAVKECGLVAEINNIYSIVRTEKHKRLRQATIATDEIEVICATSSSSRMKTIYLSLRTKLNLLELQ
jgi:hypothetical protein